MKQNLIFVIRIGNFSIKSKSVKWFSKRAWKIKKGENKMIQKKKRGLMKGLFNSICVGCHFVTLSSLNFVFSFYVLGERTLTAESHYVITRRLFNVLACVLCFLIFFIHLLLPFALLLLLLEQSNDPSAYFIHLHSLILHCWLLFYFACCCCLFVPRSRWFKKFFYCFIFKKSFKKKEKKK